MHFYVGFFEEGTIKGYGRFTEKYIGAFTGDFDNGTIVGDGIFKNYYKMTYLGPFNRERECHGEGKMFVND